MTSPQSKVDPLILNERHRIMSEMLKYMRLCKVFDQEPNFEVFLDIIADTAADKLVELDKDALLKGQIKHKELS